jgi:hypothetical protein
MPSSLNLFIRIPKGFSEQDVFDAINRKDICKIINVVIKKGKTTNNAIIMIDYWYKGTGHIRDTLLGGNPISVIVGSHMLLAYEFKSKSRIESAKVYPEPVDEFGRDIPRKINTVLRADAPAFKPALRADAPEFVPMVQSPKIAPAVSDINQRLNEFAAKSFIRQCEKEFSVGATEPRASGSDLEEGELCEIIKKHSKIVIDKPIKKSVITRNPKIDVECSHVSAAIKRKVRFSACATK